jgi:hypothetical protein
MRIEQGDETYLDMVLTRRPEVGEGRSVTVRP